MKIINFEEVKARKHSKKKAKKYLPVTDNGDLELQIEK